VLTIIDRYILKKYFTTFFFSLGLAILVSIVVDTSEKMDDFISSKVSFWYIISGYYIYFIPHFYNLFSPLFTFLAVLLITSKMASDSEIVSILASGTSYRRLLRPFMIGATVLAIITYLLNSWIIPETEMRRVDFQNHVLKGRKFDNNWKNNIHRQLEKGTFLYLQTFNHKDSFGYHMTLDKYDGLELKQEIYAEKLYWNFETQTWAVQNYFVRDFFGDGNEGVKKGDQMDITLNFNPLDVFRRNDEVGVLNNRELDEFIKAEKIRGAENLDYYVIEKYRRVAFPFAGGILTLIAFVIASRKVRGGIGIHLGLGVLIGGSFMVFSHFGNTFATSGGLDPLIAVWIPNIIFLVLGIFMYQRAPK
jgi:lipopolysaccharide export system permease protein